MVATLKTKRAPEPDLPREVSSQIEKAFFGEESNSPCNPIHAAFAYHFGNPGGGTRMRLAFRCASLLDIDRQSSCGLAAAVECLHNASLIQDDVQDHATTRRGQPTVAAKFGADVALGLTNRLVSTAFVCVSQEKMVPKMAELINKLHQAISETIDGQTIELCADPADNSLRHRMASSGKKSGPLFGLALELPLIMAGYRDHLEIARRAALRFGLGYQILDDLKDLESDDEKGNDGNLVLAMRSDPSDPSDPSATDETAATRAIALASDLLREAAEGAARLPRDSGSPLIRLVDDHLPLLDGHSR